MARSLTVTHEETPATNPLLTGFLVLAALVLIASALQIAFPERAASVAAQPVAEIDR